MIHQLILVSFLCFIASAQALVCPSGWEGPSVGGKCYQIAAKTGAPWDDAVKICADAGGILGSIESQGEQDFLMNRIFPTATDWLITGGHRQPIGTGPWVWADGSSMIFSNPGNPPLNSAVAVDQLNYLYLYAYPTAKGTANYGKTFLDRPISHQILCQQKATDPPGTCGAGAGGANCGGCGTCNNCGCNCCRC